MAGQLLADRGIDVAAVRQAEARALERMERANGGGTPGGGAQRTGATAPAGQGRRPQPARPGQARRPAPGGTGQASPAAPSEPAAPAPVPAPKAPAPKAAAPKVGRNDPCYCGSGKKYKLCHGAA
jgi:preprotein translocase subunit SecA